MAAKLDASIILGTLPKGLREELLKAFSDIISNFKQRRWEPSELNGGKLCEVVYSILRGHVDGTYPARASKPGNMVDACRSLEQAGSVFSRSVRVQIPRVLVSLYEIRNNRGVGHVGGDVDPNQMDASAVLAMSKWVVAELVRLFHGTNPKTASEAVEVLVERDLPIIWEVAGRRRVLNLKLTSKDKVLLLLYVSSGPVVDRDLVDWVEHSNPSVFRRDVLRPMHRLKLVEYDQKSRLVHISPLGLGRVEGSLLNDLPVLPTS
jgi:hypothetical protein